VSPNDSNAQHLVTAVIVAHDGARWLAEVAHAVREQTHPVHRVVGVDTGSRDRSGVLLASVLGKSSVFGADRGTGYGAAIAQALRHRAAHTPAGVGRPGADAAVEWVWLLHDDCAPDEEALEHLLDAAGATRGAAVLGPKVRDWEDRQILIEAGITIDGAGRRETAPEQYELDQGQHDGERDVLAVSSAGMLIRRDVWDRLGGFDLSLRLFRDDIDFCWRVIAAGYRVRLVTDAIVYHAEAAARRYRPISVAGAGGDRPRYLDRRNALFVLLANLPFGPMCTALCRNVAGSLIRALILLVGKQPGAAWDEVAALTSVLSHPLRLLRARRWRAHGRRSAYPVARSFMPRGKTVGRITEIVGTALAGSRPAVHSPAAVGADDEEELLTDTGLAQRIMTNPGVLAILGLTIVALVAERSLLRGGWLGGGALVPVWGGAADLWREYLAGYHDIGLGSTANASPYVAVLAALSSVLGGKPWFAVDVLLLGCVPLAGITAYLAARRIASHKAVRVWAACAYALTPVATGAIAAGRIGTAVTFVLVPVAAILAGRMLTLPGRSGRQSAWAAGLVVAVMAAFVPLVWALSAVGAALAFVAAGKSRRKVAVNLGIVAGVPVVLLVPWTFDLIKHPALFLLEAGVQRQGLANPRLPASSLLLLSPGGPGLPPVWVTAGLGIAGLTAALLNRRRVLVAVGWAAAVIGLLTAIAVSRVTAAPPAGGPAVPGWPGAALVVTAAGMLLAGLVAAETWPALMRAGGLRRAGGVALALLACSAPALVAGFWVVSSVPGPLAGTRSSVLPEFVTASAANGTRLRTLVLRSGPGPLHYTLLRNADPLLGEPELAQPAGVMQRLDSIVAGLTTGSGADLGDDGHTLDQFAIGFVLLPAPMDQRLVRVLDGTPGLRPVSLTAGFGLWQVTDVTARVRVVEANGTVVPVPSGRVDVRGAPVPAAGGTLVLAEPVDAGWHASLNGRALTPLAGPVDGWAQGFNLPAGGGRLDISRSMLDRQVAIWLEGLALVVVAVFALPSALAVAAAAEEDPAAGGGAAARRGSRRKPGKANSRRARRAPRGRPATAGHQARTPMPGRAQSGSATPGGAGGSPGSGAVRGAAVPGTGARAGGHARHSASHAAPAGPPDPVQSRSSGTSAARPGLPRVPGQTTPPHPQAPYRQRRDPRPREPLPPEPPLPRKPLPREPDPSQPYPPAPYPPASSRPGPAAQHGSDTSRWRR
jgi:GT2 family glycosyltransferase